MGVEDLIVCAGMIPPDEDFDDWCCYNDDIGPWHQTRHGHVMAWPPYVVLAHHGSLCAPTV